ncbi:MAG: hydantoinase B/oxoprolinase family protein, partial [Euryarchaeota archaeon]|nr:hydantoinase B/oxoprolinase family protein [Euryarchaeota archaeon]
MNAIEFEIFNGKIKAIAEQMGELLRRSAYSPNIRERMDASCAVFDSHKHLIAQAEHIPVHLGSMHIPLSYINDFEEGDQLIVNDPAMGGTHLPDITIYRGVYHRHELVGFVGTRAHHADVGGIAPGSMPGNSSEIYQEGLIIPPVKIVRDGKLNEDVLSIVLSNTRTPRERKGDLMAQLSVNEYGARKVQEFIDDYGVDKYEEYILTLKEHTARMMQRRMLAIPSLPVVGEERLETREPAIIKVRTWRDSRIHVDYTGSSEAMRENLNAPFAVTLSATYFFFRTVLGADVPVNSFFYEFFDIVAPEGTLLNPPPGYPVVAGNVETSQRIVDALLLAFSHALELPAQSHGSMNNVTFGNSRFTYYETIGGGAGAAKNYNGESGVHVYMTNTRNTPVEVIEKEYPLRVLAYHLREGSGGAGQWRGGEGIVRHYLVLEDCTFSVLSERRKLAPKG